MANRALLFWCAASALVCGSAALATSSLWRAPASPTGSVASSSDTSVDAKAQVSLAPAPVTESDAPAPVDRFIPLASVSFFSASPDSVALTFRDVDAGALPLADALTEAQPMSGADFIEVKPDAIGSDHRLGVRPPPRPSFQLARIDAAGKASIGELQSAQPAPGFETPAPVPQATPGWNWNDVFQPLGRPSGNERVLNAGIASWYGPGFHGRKTASGERFDQNDMTAAHRTLPFGTRVKVVDEKTGRSIVVRINDRGPFSHGRVIDLSKQAAQTLGMGGLARVKVVSAN